MSISCPICKKSGKVIIDKVKKNYAVKFYSCNTCELHYSELHDQPKKVLKYSSDLDYVFTNTYRDTKKCKFDEYAYRLKRINNVKVKKTILDIGCADGKILSQLKKKKYEIYGIEINKHHIEQLNKKKINFYNKDILTYFPKRKFDLVLMFAVLEHLPNIVKYIRHIKKNILSSKGTILLDLPNLYDPLNFILDINEYRKFYYKKYHLYYFSKKSLTKLFRKLGFKIKVEPLQQASITNHFHWMHKRSPQKSTNIMSSIHLPTNLLNNSKKNTYIEILNNVDDFYNKQLIENEIGDLLFAEIKNLK